MKKHTEYGILNDEWLLNSTNDVSLHVYLGCRLDIIDREDRLLKYAGIRNYYIRNRYGYDYKSSSLKNGITAGRHMLDPWNREFLVFPYDKIRYRGSHGYNLFFGRNVYCDIQNNDVVNGFWTDAIHNYVDHNVVLLSTTVCGGVVYCVDILAGVYRNH